jgi:hypothetical protein
VSYKRQFQNKARNQTGKHPHAPQRQPTPKPSKAQQGNHTGKRLGQLIQIRDIRRRPSLRALCATGIKGLPLPLQWDAAAWCRWLFCQSQWRGPEAWPDSAFCRCLRHGLACRGPGGSLCGAVVADVLRGLPCWLLSIHSALTAVHSCLVTAIHSCLVP